MSEPVPTEAPADLPPLDDDERELLNLRAERDDYREALVAVTRAVRLDAVAGAVRAAKITLEIWRRPKP